MSHSLCKHTIATGRPLVLDDARRDPILRHNGAVTELGVVAYAGVPLVTPEGQTIGAVCAVDGEPRQWRPQQLTDLQRFADQAAQRLAAEATSRR